MNLSLDFELMSSSPKKVLSIPNLELALDPIYDNICLGNNLPVWVWWLSPIFCFDQCRLTKGIMNKGIIFRPPFTSLDGINFIRFLSLYFPRLRSEMISYMNHFENYLVLLAIGTNIQANWTNRVKPWNPKI